MNVSIRPFERADFQEYQLWFSDEALNKELGPMEPDDEWLEHILTEENGETFAAFDDDKLVGVVSTLLPDDQHEHYYITDFAVRPDLRGTDTAKDLLEALILHHSPTASWRCFISDDNKRARAFFEKQKWTYASEYADEHGMWEMIKIEA